MYAGMLICWRDGMRLRRRQDDGRAQRRTRKAGCYSFPTSGKGAASELKQRVEFDLARHQARSKKV